MDICEPSLGLLRIGVKTSKAIEATHTHQNVEGLSSIRSSALLFWVIIYVSTTCDCGHPVLIIYAIRTRTTKSPKALPVQIEAYNSSPGLVVIGIP